MTFKELVNRVIADNYPDFWDMVNPVFTYTLELTSPENRVVTPYADRAMHLLTVRDRRTLAEVTLDEMMGVGLEMGVSLPQSHSFSDVEDLLKMSRSVGKLDEGFVCVNYSERFNGYCWGRVKVKNPAYVAIAHLKESSASSLRGLMQLVILGEEEEFLSYFPEYKPHVEQLRGKYDEHLSLLEAAWDELAHLAGDQSREGRKTFALEAKKSVNPGYMFMLFNGHADSVKGCIENNINQYGLKRVAKGFLKTLKVKDIDFETVE
jgi:hypothetical protein